LVEGIPQRGAY